MLVVFSIIFFLKLIQVNCVSTIILQQIHQDEKIINCIIGILDKYYADRKEITYVNIKSRDDVIIKEIHAIKLAPIVTRDGTTKISIPHEGYLIVADNVEDFVENFDNLTREELWNPYVRFLIVIRSLQEEQVKNIFTPLLKHHVNNVLVVNGTEDVNLYTYNPFDNYACGRYFENVISYGQCLETTKNLFPNKFVTGLRNCTFFATVPHRPPYALDPSLTQPGEATTGAEQHVFKILADLEQFKIQYKYNYGEEVFTKIYPNMTAVGPFEILQNNETDVIFGGTMLAASQIYAFTVLYGHLEFYDGFLFFVKRASPEPTWKNFYLEFYLPVWLALFFGWMLYSVAVMLLLPSEDKYTVILRLLDSLLQHGCHFRCRTSVKCVILLWVWFAFLINVFYQSSLVSLTMSPAVEYQVSTEGDLKTYNMKACMRPSILNYVKSENPNHNFTLAHDCPSDDMQAVNNSKEYFTLIGRTLFEYNINSCYDKWGNPLFYLFKKSYAKIMNVIFFYKGFPVSDRLRSNIIKVRENGLMTKHLEDQFYSRKIQNRFHFHDKGYETRFSIPWLIYIPGCAVALITFVVEVIVNKKTSDGVK